MKKVVTLSILITILTSCNSTGDQTSAIIKSIDTITEVSQKKEIKDELEPDLSTILSDFKEMANKAFIEDTVLVINNDSFSISLKHYPLPDSPVVVPKTYVGIYELDSFTAPNFKSSVTITQGGKTILQREISKNDFREFLDTPTNNYAVLLYPYVSSENNHIELHYSISVPLTDVGIGVGAKVDKNGDIKFELR